MAPSTSDPSRFLLVTGSTRSGTSTAAGMLHHLGLVVPMPVLKPNPSNPSGFFESVWPIAYHKRLLAAAGVSPTDARPEAFDRVAAAVGQAERDELAAWLREVSTQGPRVVVKDPRSAWVPDLWADTASVLGAGVGIIAMLRHPAEVVASRATYYGSRIQGGDPWAYRVRNLCAWINLNTGLERLTRGRPRLVVRYEDLVADWRSVASRIDETFDVRLDSGEGAAARAVDAFIDPDLRRHAPTWAGSDLPASLVELAEAVWEVLGDLASGGPDDAVGPRLDALREAYATQMRIAEAMTPDVIAAAVRARQAVAASPGGAPAPATAPPAGGQPARARHRMPGARTVRRAIRRVATPVRRLGGRARRSP